MCSCGSFGWVFKSNASGTSVLCYLLIPPTTWGACAALKLLLRRAHWIIVGEVAFCLDHWHLTVNRSRDVVWKAGAVLLHLQERGKAAAKGCDGVGTECIGKEISQSVIVLVLGWMCCGHHHWCLQHEPNVAVGIDPVWWHNWSWSRVLVTLLPCPQGLEGAAVY